MFDDIKLGKLGKKTGKLDLKSFKIRKNKSFSINKNFKLDSKPKKRDRTIFSSIVFRPALQRTESRHKHLRFMFDSDGDGVPDFRDCRPYNPRFHSNGKIDKARAMFGTTSDPYKAGWILPDGSYLDMSTENIRNVFGDEPVGTNQLTSDRQIAHWEVGRAFGISGRAANRAFERAGAIRFRKTAGRGLYVEMVKKPTREQAMAIVRAIQTPPRPTFMVFEKVPSTIKPLSLAERQSNYMKTTKIHPIMFQKFISQVF